MLAMAVVSNQQSMSEEKTASVNKPMRTKNTVLEVCQQAEALTGSEADGCVETFARGDVVKSTPFFVGVVKLAKSTGSNFAV